jgi:hypothetical protein
MVWVLNTTPEVDSTSQYPMIIAVCTALSVASSACVGTRLWIRHRSRGLAHDDWMAGLSMAFALIYGAMCIAQTRYGLGLPLLDRPKENLIIYTRVNFAGRPIYQIGISFFKIALLISYLRLLQGTNNKAYRIVVYSTIAGVFLTHLACALSLIFACTPVDKSWNPLKDGTCLPPGPSFTAYAIVTIISDVVVAVLPVPLLLKLNIQKEKKFGLIGIFTLGLFTTLCSVFRYLQIDRIQFGDGNSTMLILWGVIEFNVGNIVSSLPFLAPIFIRKAKDYRSKQSSNERYAYGSGYGKRKSRVLRAGDAYMLSDRPNDKTFASAAHMTNRSGSEDNILHPHGNDIIKSVTYTVQVDEDPDRQEQQQQQQQQQPHGDRGVRPRRNTLDSVE